MSFYIIHLFEFCQSHVHAIQQYKIFITVKSPSIVILNNRYPTNQENRNRAHGKV